MVITPNLTCANSVCMIKTVDFSCQCHSSLNYQFLNFIYFYSCSMIIVKTLIKIMLIFYCLFFKKKSHVFRKISFFRCFKLGFSFQIFLKLRQVTLSNIKRSEGKTRKTKGILVFRIPSRRFICWWLLVMAQLEGKKTNCSFIFTSFFAFSSCDLLFVVLVIT